MCPSVDSIVTKPNTGTEQRSVSHNASVLLFHSAFIFRCSIPGETIGESWGVSFSFSALAFFVAFGLVLCFRFFPAETVWPACCCLPFIPTLGRIPWIDLRVSQIFEIYLRGIRMLRLLLLLLILECSVLLSTGYVCVSVCVILYVR